MLPVILPDLSQFLFLLMRHLFQCRLTFHRLGFRIKLLQIGKRNRPPGPCILCSGSVIMCLNAFFNIVCPSGVQTVVTAPDQICIIHPFSADVSPIATSASLPKICKRIFQAQQNTRFCITIVSVQYPTDTYYLYKATARLRIVCQP